MAGTGNTPTNYYNQPSNGAPKLSAKVPQGKRKPKAVKGK